MKKKKSKSLNAKLKEKCWKLCSQYNRMKNADKHGRVKCVTCVKVDHWKRLQAGHYVDGRNNSVLFKDELIYAQCFHCNSKRPGCLAGNKIQYTKYMLSLGYTIAELFEFDMLKFKTRKYTAYELECLIQEYREKIEDLKVGIDIRETLLDQEGHTAGHMGV